MAAQTGRTVPKHQSFHIDDSGGTLREITGFTSISGTGLDYEDMDVTALADAIMNSLPGQPDLTLTVNGRFDTTATTGFHTVFSALAGVATPLSFDLRIGMRQTWESGEPQFGMTSSATSGVWVKSYTLADNGIDATAVLRVFGGTAPAWGTAAET